MNDDILHPVAQAGFEARTGHDAVGPGRHKDPEELADDARGARWLHDLHDQAERRIGERERDRFDEHEDFPSDEPDDVFLNDATPLRCAIQQILSGPNGWRVPGGDHIDTIIALVGAVAPELDACDRYAAWVNLVRLDEHCKGFGLESPASMDEFAGEFFNTGGGTQLALVWSDHRGPLKAIHRVRSRGQVSKYVWSRPQ